MKNAIYWIALQNILGYGANDVTDILESFEDVSSIFSKSIKLNDVRFLGEKKFKKLKSFDLRKAEAIIDYCNNKGIEIITVDDDKYPVVLKRIKNPPAVLYVRGELPNFDEEVGIGMVGTRECSVNGMIVAATLAYRIAQAGAVVISGGANGIDTRCTQGALFAKQPSVIVRPCGLDYNYLNSLSDIRKQVENCGAVISEVQPLGRVERDAFQIRNRIIAALSLGVVAIEVPERSGVLITVGYALEFGKDIFAIPGDISDENYRGSNKLLHDGATPVYTAADVLDEYVFAFPHKLKLDNAKIPINDDDIYLKLQKKYSVKAVPERFDVSDTQQKTSIISRVKKKFTKEENIKQKLDKLPFEADKTVKLVYDFFEDKPVSIDYLSEKSGISTAEVLASLTELEINGIIKQLPGGRFEIK